MFWTELPDQLDPRAVPLLTDFVLHGTIPPKGEAALAVLNVAGYGSRIAGLTDDEGMRSSLTASHDEEVVAVQQLQAAMQGDAGMRAVNLPWKTLIGIALKLFQAILVQ